MTNDRRGRVVVPPAVSPAGLLDVLAPYVLLLGGTPHGFPAPSLRCACLGDTLLSTPSVQRPLDPGREEPAGNGRALPV